MNGARMNGARKTLSRIGWLLLVPAVAAVRGGSPSFPAGCESVRMKPDGFHDREDVRFRFDSGTAVVEFLLGERESRALILTKRKTWAAVLPSRNGIERSVNGFIRAVGRSADYSAAVCRAARRIAAEILPFEPELAGLGVNRLILIPDGILGRLAFDALRTADGADEIWLIDRYAVSYAPSAALLKEGRTKPGSEGLRLLALGASDLRTGRPGAYSFRREIRAIGRLYPRRSQCLYLDRRAGKTNFLRHRGECFQVVHIAAHGRRPIPPSASTRLIFSSGAEDLRAGNIRGCGISAELVVLSACETAAGLPRTFLREGARSVVATLWSIPDRTTADFMVDFYGGLKTGLDKSASLRSAKLRMIRRGRSHPFYWAGYVLFGEPDGTIVFP